MAPAKWPTLSYMLQIQMIPDDGGIVRKTLLNSRDSYNVKLQMNKNHVYVVLGTYHTDVLIFQYYIANYLALPFSSTLQYIICTFTLTLFVLTIE